MKESRGFYPWIIGVPFQGFCVMLHSIWIFLLLEILIAYMYHRKAVKQEIDMKKFIKIS
jgi:hypothetical protein